MASFLHWDSKKETYLEFTDILRRQLEIDNATFQLTGDIMLTKYVVSFVEGMSSVMNRYLNLATSIHNLQILVLMVGIG